MKKKFVSLVFVFIMVLSLPACSKDEGTDGTGAASENAVKQDTSDSASKDTEDTTADVNGNTGDSSSDAISSDAAQENQPANRNSMEGSVAGYLSKIGGPDKISICDGASFEFEPWSGWSLWGDQWVVKQPDAAKGQDIIDSLDKQLVEGCGFKKSLDLWGTNYYVNAGVEQLGIKVMYSFDSEEPQYNEVTIAMTHSPECYSVSFIEEMNAKMPKVNAFLDAREKLPENYQITFMQGTLEKTITSKDGSYFIGEIDRDSSGWNTTGYNYVFITNGDGTFTRYENNGYMSDTYNKAGDCSTEDVESYIKYYFDTDGQNENGSLSTWGQISTEYLNGETTDFLNDPCLCFAFSTTFAMTEPEEIAGVMCDTCADDNLWTKTAFAYEPETGITFRIVRTESGSEPVTLFEVKEFNTEPESLGNFKAE